MIAVYGINIEDIPAHGKRSLRIGGIFPRVTRVYQRANERLQVRFLSLLQAEYGQAAGKKLNCSLYVAHQHFRALFPFVQCRQTAVKRVFGKRLAIGKHFVFGAKKRALFARKRRNRLRRARSGKRVRRKIHRPTGIRRRDQIF